MCIAWHRVCCGSTHEQTLQVAVHRPDVVASNGKLHDATLGILNEP